MNHKDLLKKTAEEAREMHRLYPFTKTVSSAAKHAKANQKAAKSKKP